MAKGNTYVCASCGKEFVYCPSCAVTIPLYDAERFCCKRHAKIFEILSKHGCHLATAEETLAALKGYDTTGLSESIQAHIDSLHPKNVEAAEEKSEDKKAVETINKKYSFRTQE